MITILSWKWHGWRGDTYRAEHVNALARMLAEHMTGDYRLVCVTDDPAGITECDTYPLWDDPPVVTAAGKPACWRRLKLFSPWARETFGPLLLSILIRLAPGGVLIVDVRRGTDISALGEPAAVVHVGEKHDRLLFRWVGAVGRVA